MTPPTKPTAESADPPRLRYLYLSCLLFLGAGAVAGGASLVLDPTGGRIGLPFELIEGTVFGDYLVPGIVLFGVLGVGSFVVAYGAVRRTRWAWPAGVALGAATLVWIGVQIVTVRLYFFLQPVIAGVGLAIVLLLAAPSMRRYYRAEESLAVLGVDER